MPKVLITREIPQVGLEMLKKHPEIELDYRKGPPLSDKELKEAIKDVDAIIPVIPDRITKEVIESGKNLKVIATYSVGYDHVDLETATKNKIFVGNTPGDLTESVGEHAFALMMDITRRTTEADRYCRGGKYEFWDPMLFIGPKLKGKTLGIVGFGRIGQKFAKMCKYGFDMEIIYTDINCHPEADSLLDAKKVEFDYLLENSDIISVHCNLSEETKGMFGTNEFRKMKPLAYIINTARGPIINEQALADALENGIIAGAGLDVFEKEPEINSKLLKLDNVVLTPHIASATLEARIQMARMAVENVLDVIVDKKAPRYLVNKEILKESIDSLA